jgi:hypothetical protein
MHQATPASPSSPPKLTAATDKQHYHESVNVKITVTVSFDRHAVLVSSLQRWKKQKKGNTMNGGKKEHAT